MILLSPSFGSFRKGEPTAYEVGKRWVEYLIHSDEKKIVLSEAVVSLVEDKLYVQLKDDNDVFEFEVVGL